MTIELELRPTLLVGVGGTGSLIADRILKQVRENAQELTPSIRMLAVDTDAGDLDRLKDLPDESRIQFSKPEYVKVTLDRNPDIQRTWCYSLNDPEMTEEILNTVLIEGAAQIRMLTRLALHDSLKNGEMLPTMENAIARLAVHGDRQANLGAVQLLMIGSFGGATGSGSFIQLALALRKAAENRNVTPIMRGLFLMPDIFVRSGVLKSSEWENVLSNGYAAMKELNAVNLRSSLRDLETEFTFEYAPGYTVGPGPKVFEEVYFIDFENTLGGSMGKNLNAYINMAARAAYLNVFTPLGPKLASQSVNQKRQRQTALSEGQVSVYSGIGVAAIEYPIASITRYLSRRLVHENLRGDWTRLDVGFREQVARHKKDVAAGATTAEEPNRRASFLRDFTQLAKEDPPNPFFRRAYDRLFPVVEDQQTFNKTEAPIHLAYVNALLDYVKRQFWNDNEMKRVHSRSPLDESGILESDSIVDSVRQEEFMLDRDFAALEAQLGQRPADIFQNALISADTAAPEEWARHHLQAYIVQQGLHPVAVRAFLYLVQEELERRAENLNPRDRKRKLFALANIYRSEEEMQAAGDIPQTRGTSGVIEAATVADNTNMIRSIFRGKKKAFATDYVIYNTKSLTLMRAYADETIEARVIDQALTEVGNLVRAFEGLFGEIEAIGDDLGNELTEESAEFDTSGTVFTGSSYVYANAACREDAWQRLAEASTGLTIEADVNRELTQAVFSKHRSDRRDRVKTGFSELRELFHREIVIGFGQRTVERDYRSIYDMNVIEAIRRQYGVEKGLAEERGNDLGVSEAQYIKRIVDRVSDQSLPYLSLRRPDSDGTGVKLWAIHPGTRAAVTDNAEFLDLFQSENSGENAVVEPQFSPYALICANLRVNLEPQNFAKLMVASEATEVSSGTTEGRMTRAYNATINRMLDPARMGREGAEFTPHVDKNWHLPGALPELHASLDERISTEKFRAYVIARALELVRFDADERNRIARISTLGHGIRDGIDDVVAESHDPWAVYQGMTRNIRAVRSTLAVWERKIKAPAANAASHPCFKALTNPDTLNAIFAPAQVRNEAVQAREDAVREATAAWVGLLRDVIEAQETSTSARARADMVGDAVNATRDAFFAVVRQEQHNVEVQRAYDSLFAQATDSIFAE